MRKKQRKQQGELEKILDGEKKNEGQKRGNADEAATGTGTTETASESKRSGAIYCKLCKLLFHQARNEHDASEMHRLIVDFLNPSCAVCGTTYGSPMAYERHIASLSHLKVSDLTER